MAESVLRRFAKARQAGALRAALSQQDLYDNGGRQSLGKVKQEEHLSCPCGPQYGMTMTQKLVSTRDGIPTREGSGN